MDGNSGFHQRPPVGLPQASASRLFPYYVSNPAAEPLGLSGYFPGSHFLGRSKRTAQRELPCHLEPKEKEHQRKKVLRNFLSWRSKQPTQSDSEIKFWAWTRSINPDNTTSEDRFKSMSYEFLDKLLEKRQFRDSFEGWLRDYDENLGSGEEDSKTKIFLKFIRDSISLKLYLDRVKTELLASLTPLDSETMAEGVVLGRSMRYPEAPGVYAEGRCKKRDCSSCQVKSYFFVGARGRFSYSAIAGGCSCAACDGKVVISMVGFLNCRWRYAGEQGDGKTVSGAEAIVW